MGTFLRKALLLIYSCVSAVPVVTTCASVTLVRPAPILFSQRRTACSGTQQRDSGWQGGDRCMQLSPGGPSPEAWEKEGVGVDSISHKGGRRQVGKAEVAQP